MPVNRVRPILAPRARGRARLGPPGGGCGHAGHMGLLANNRSRQKKPIAVGLRAGRKGGNMKKVLVGVSVVLIGLAALFAAAGCSSGDTATARQYMKTADTAYAAVNSELTTLSSKATAVFTAALSGNLSSVNPADISSVATTTAKLLPQIAAVKSSYQKMNGLSGLQEYKDYANAMVKALDADAAIVSAGAALVAKLQPILASGDVAALNAAIQQSMTEITRIQTLQKAAETSYANAQKIKKDKNLGQ